MEAGSGGPKSAEVISLVPNKDAIRALIVERGLCHNDEYAQKLVDRFEAYPAFFSYLNEILSQRRKRFSADDFHSAIAYGSSDSETLSACVNWMRATRSLADDRFDLVWKVYKDNRARFQGANPEQALIEISRVLDTVFSTLPRLSYFGGANFARAEVVIERSAEMERDLRLLTATLDSVSHATSAADLKQYFDEGHQYICHPKYWEARRKSVSSGGYTGSFSITGAGESWEAKMRREQREREEAELKREVEVRSVIAKQRPYPSFDVQDRIVPQILKVKDDALKGQVLKLLPVFVDQEIPMEHYEALLAACSGRNTERVAEQQDPIVRILVAVAGYEIETLTTALSVLEEILGKTDADMERYVEIFERGDLSEVEREIYREKLAAHAAKFPEKPIEDVRAGFLEPEHIDSEVVEFDHLDRALEAYQGILSAGEELIPLPDTEIIRRAGLVGREGADVGRVEFFALARELFKREYGVYPYNTQLIAILLLLDEEVLEKDGEDNFRGIYEQIKTGEGKSLILSMVATYFAVQGREVDLITSNPYLAKRDSMKFGRYYGYFDVDVDSFEHKEGAEAVMERNPGIVYTTNHDMIFAYLAARLNGKKFFNGKRFDVCLVDEADNLCIDMGQDSCRIAQPAESMFEADVLAKFIEFADTHGEHILADLPKAIAEFRRFAEVSDDIHTVYIGLYLRSAVRSSEVRVGEDFIVREGKIVIIDVHNTGRLKERTHWSHGLHEFVTLRQGLDLPQSMGVAAEMNHPTFIRRYRNMYCISGTMGDSVDRSEIQEVYNLKGLDVPSHYPSRREDSDLIIFPSPEEFLEGVLARVREVQASGRPVLLLTQSVAESAEFCSRLREAGYQVQLLNDHTNQDASANPAGEDMIIDHAGQSGMITVATSVAGRGADIKPDERGAAAGGLHALLTFVPFNKRVEFQNRGRAGRQGQQGTSEIIACAESDLFVRNMSEDLQKLTTHVVREYGADSEEVRIVIDLIRRGSNLLSSTQRRFNYDKDAVIQEALDGYFAKMAFASGRLGKANVTVSMNSGLASYLFSLYVGEEWAREFDYFQTVLRHDSAEPEEGSNVVSLDAFREAQEAPQQQQPEAFESRFLPRLNTCLERSVHGYPQAKLSDSPFGNVVGYLYQYFAARLVTIEQRMATFDEERAKRLLDGLTEKVDSSVERFHEEFKGASVTDIRAYLDRKRKEREGQQEGD